MEKRVEMPVGEVLEVVGQKRDHMEKEALQAHLVLEMEWVWVLDKQPEDHLDQVMAQAGEKLLQFKYHMEMVIGNQLAQ